MKVQFDGTNRLIIVSNGVTELNVQTDLYSDWKEWLKEADNSKYLPAMRTVGGDPTTGIKSVAPYFFLINGWKIRPYEGNHILTIEGNLFVDEPEIYGYNPCVPTQGNYNVTISMSTTSDAILIGMSDISFLRDVMGGRWRIANNQMIFYKSDNITEVARFNLLDSDGLPAMRNVMERVRV